MLNPEDIMFALLAPTHFFVQVAMIILAYASQILSVVVLIANLQACFSHWWV